MCQMFEVSYKFFHSLPWWSMMLCPLCSRWFFIPGRIASSLLKSMHFIVSWYPPFPSGSIAPMITSGDSAIIYLSSYQNPLQEHISIMIAARTTTITIVPKTLKVPKEFVRLFIV